MSRRVLMRPVLGLLAAALLGVVVAAPAAAYGGGPANWQVAFSGNFNHTPQGSSGFWGWCALAGGVSAGNSADCQATFYFSPGSGSGASAGNLIHESISGTSWDVELSTSPPPPPLPQNDFFITDGTVTINGPTLGPIIRSGAPPPPGCSVRGSTVTCTIAAAERIGLYMPDTGVPAAAGHFTLDQVADMFGIPVPPGTHINFQVNQL
jgi:hypothetical protein